MKESVLNGAILVAKHKKPFYAEDLELNGGVINALAYSYNLIRPTGNRKEIFVNVGEDWRGHETYIKTEVMEWTYNEKSAIYLAKRFEDEANSLLVLAEALYSLDD